MSRNIREALTDRYVGATVAKAQATLDALLDDPDRLQRPGGYDRSALELRNAELHVAVAALDELPADVVPHREDFATTQTWTDHVNGHRFSLPFCYRHRGARS